MDIKNQLNRYVDGIDVDTDDPKYDNYCWELYSKHKASIDNICQGDQENYMYGIDLLVEKLKL